MHRTGALLLLFASACSSAERVFVPAAEFGPEVLSVFYTMLDIDDRVLVFAANPDSTPNLLESDTFFPENGTVYAAGDAISLAAHGLEPGMLRPSASTEGRRLPTGAVQSFSLVFAPPTWSDSSLPDAAQRFLFDSDVPNSRCARLEKLAEYDYAELQMPRPDAEPPPVGLLPLDDERLFVIGDRDHPAFVLSPTSSRAVELGVDAYPGMPRAMYLAPDGEIFTGTGRGEVFRGRPETGFFLSATLDVPPRPGEEAGALGIQALTGSRGQSDAPEVFASTLAYFLAVEPNAELILQRPVLGTGRQEGGAVWLSPGRVLFAIRDERRAHELRNGRVRLVSTSDVDITGMDYVEGFGAVAVTLDGRLHVYDPELGEFEIFAENLSTRGASIAGNRDRLFILADNGVLQQFVPGEGLCAPINQRPRGSAQVVVYGRYLAKTGSDGVEIWQIISPEDEHALSAERGR